MWHRIFIFAVLFTIVLGAKTKKTPVGVAEDDGATVSATLLSEEELKEKLGSNLGGFYVVIEVTVSPKTKPYTISRDDFLLRTDRDGERSKPFAPTQIAGKGALIVSQTGGGRGIMGDNNGPIWGGYPGGGRPQRIGGDGGGSSSESETQTKVVKGQDKENPVLAALTARILQEKEVQGPLTGLLYFAMEPKQKPKELELIYTTPAGKLNLRFR